MSYHANETVEVKTCDLIDAALDWAVAKCEGILGIHVVAKPGKTCIYGKMSDIDSPYQPSTGWSQGGPIIEKNDIAIDKCSEVWCSSVNDKPIAFYHPTPLIAAMRCYVASKLGDTVKIPKDLLLNSSK